MEPEAIQVGQDATDANQVEPAAIQVQLAAIQVQPDAAIQVHPDAIQVHPDVSQTPFQVVTVTLADCVLPSSLHIYTQLWILFD
jgi:hypothetical protein